MGGTNGGLGISSLIDHISPFELLTVGKGTIRSWNLPVFWRSLGLFCRGRTANVVLGVAA